MTKRERTYAIIAGSVLGLMVFWYMILSPLLARREAAVTRLERNRQDLGAANETIRRAKTQSVYWAELATAGVKRDAPEAEGQVLNSVREWAQEAGLTLSSVKTERSDKERDYQRVTFRANAGGTMSALSRFLYRIESAQIPIRVTEFSVASHKDGQDDLTIQMGIATIYGTGEKSARPAGSEGRS